MLFPLTSALHLVSSTLSLNSGYLALEFSSNVRSESLDPSLVELRSNTTSYSLTGQLDVFEASNSSKTLTLVLVQRDYVALLFYDLTYLVLAQGAVWQSDRFEGFVSVVPDSYPPSIVQYALDMDEGTLNVQFDEPMNSSWDLTFVTMQSAANTNDAEARTTLVNAGVSAANRTTLADSVWLNLTLGKANLDRIKANSPIATFADLTFLALTGGAFRDRAGNDATTNFWTVYEAKPPFSWVGDTTPPELVSFELDMDAGTLLLSFSEVVDVSELVVTELRLQECQNASAVPCISHQLDDSSAVGGDAADVLVSLSATDLDGIKSKSRLAVDAATSWLAMTGDETFRDTAVRPNIGVRLATSDAQQATTFLADVTRPQIVAWHLNLNDRSVHIQFDEAVNASSLDIAALSLQDSKSFVAGETDRILLRAPPTTRSSTVVSRAGVNVTVALGARDFALVKLAENLGTSRDLTYLAASPGAVLDMAGNLLQERSIFNALQAASITDDSTPPTLETYALDMDSGILALSFDEPVARASLDTTKLHVRGGPAEADVPGVDLVGGHTFVDSMATSIKQLDLQDEPTHSDAAAEVLLVVVSSDDLDNLKLADGVADALATTWLQAAANWVADYPDFNEAYAVADVAALNFSADVTSPTLESFELDLDNDELTLVADEPLRATSANATRFRLTSKIDGSGASRVDFTDLTRPSVNGRRLVFDLHWLSLDAIKVDTARLGSSDTTRKWLDVFERGAANDMAGNALHVALAEDNASVPCARTAPDTTPPQLVGFDLELDAYNLTLRFDEPVVSLADSWVLQRGASSSLGFVKLTGVRAPDAAAARVVEAVSPSDVRARLAARGDLATTQDDTYLRATLPNGVLDVAGNAMGAIADGAALRLGPSLSFFELDMDAGTLSMAFSEPIDVEGFRPQSLVLQEEQVSSKNTERLTLSADSHVKADRGSRRQVVTLTFTSADLDSLRYFESLSRGNASTWLVAAADVTTDLDDDGAKIGPNQLVEAWSASAGASSSVRAAKVAADVTRPTFLECTLDLDELVLTLGFDEPVRAASLRLGKVQIRDSKIDPLVAVSLTPGSVAREDAATLVVDLSTRDAALLKAAPQLGTSVNATWCSLESHAVEDCGAGVPPGGRAATSRAAILKASEVVRDTTPPSIQTFVLDLDAHAIRLAFDEPVNLTTVDPLGTGVALASSQVATLAATYHLTCSTVTAEGLNASVVIDLCGVDSQAIALLAAAGGICAAASNCYFLHGSRFAFDAAVPPNYALSIDIEFAVLAAAIIPDVSPPSLAAFQIDLDGGYLAFDCDEVVDASSVNVDAVTLQSAAFNDLVATRALSSARGTQLTLDNQTLARNSTQLLIKLGRDDLDAVKALGGVGLALSAASTYVSLAEGAFADVSGNRAEAVPVFIGFGPASSYTADTTRPRLLAFSRVSETRQILYALFDEPVDHESVNLSQWTLQRASSYVSANALTLEDALYGAEVLEPGQDFDAADAADANAPYSTTIAIDLNDAFDEAQARRAFLSQDTAYLGLGANALRDVAQNRLWSDDELAAEFYPDTGGGRALEVGPRLEAAALDMNAGVLALGFTANLTVSNESLDVTAVTLQAAANDDAVSVTLSSESTVAGAVRLDDSEARLLAPQLLQSSYERTLSDESDRVVRIHLSTSDVWALQRAAARLAKSSASTFVTISSSFGAAPSNTAILGDPLSLVETRRDRALMLGSFAVDRTAPALRAYALDMNTGVLDLNFSEPVHDASMNVSALRLRVSDASDAAEVTLRSFSSYFESSHDAARATCDDTKGNFSEACSYARLVLGPFDFDAVRAIKAGSVVSVEADLARDTAWPRANALAPATLAVGRFVKDATAPFLEAFTLDLDKGALILNYSEPVDPLTFNASHLTLSKGDNVTLALRDATSLQVVGTRSLYVRLRFDLVRLKTQIALSPSAATTLNATYRLAATRDYVRDTAFPDPANPAAAVDSRKPDRVVPDMQGPRLVSVDVSRDIDSLDLYFDEPIVYESFNASSLLIFGANRTGLRLNATSGSLVDDSPYHLRVPLAPSASRALTDIAGVTQSACYVAHPNGGVIKDVVGDVVAVPGAGPFAVDDDFTGFVLDGVTTGLGAYTALPAGPILATFVLDMDRGQLRLVFNHNLRTQQINTSAITIAAADDATAYAYKLQNATVSSVSTDEGETHVTIDLDATDLDGLKHADGSKGASPVATLLENTYAATSAAVVRSDLGTPCVARTLGADFLSAVASIELHVDATAPTLELWRLDMDSGVLVVYMDEPVRAAEADVSHMTLYNNATLASSTASLTPAASQPVNDGASKVVIIQLATADLNELKRIDYLATSLNDTFLGFGADAIVDRAHQGNAVASEVLHALSRLDPDVTSPKLVAFDADFETGTLTFHFDEPVVVASFNASGITLQEKNLAANGQSYRFASYGGSMASAASAASQTVIVTLGDGDFTALNLMTRLAKDADSTRLALSSSTFVDVFSNPVATIFDGQSMAVSAYAPDSTPPELARFWLDMDAGILTLNFTEPVAFATLDATRLVLAADASASSSLRLSVATTAATFYGDAGMELGIEIAATDLNALKALSTVATSLATTYLSVDEGAVEDMTGNLLAAISEAKPCAFYVADSTRPALDAFDIDMNIAKLTLEFSETIDQFDATGIQLMAGTSVYEAGGHRLVSGDDDQVTHGTAENSNMVYVDLGASNWGALKIARVGTAATYAAVDAKAALDVTGLSVVRIAPADVQGGTPLQARSVTPDTTPPVVVRATYAQRRLHVFYDEPIADVAPGSFTIESGQGLELVLNSIADYTEITLDLNCDVCADNETVCSSSNTCNAVDSKDDGALYVSATVGAVTDYAGNPSAAWSLATTPPTCVCATGFYIAQDCTETADAVCVACSTACPAHHFERAPCADRSDLGCQRCRDCGPPFYVAEACSGTQDTVCSACTTCKPSEYEASACSAGQDAVCVSCMLDRECAAPSEACEDAGRWWRLANCCTDDDGTKVACNERIRANTRITARDSRRHWVFGETSPHVEDGHEFNDIVNSAL